MKTFSLNFKPSSYLTCILSLFGVAMLMIILFLSVFWAYKLLLILIAVLGLVYSIAKDALHLLASSPVSLHFASDNKIKLGLKSAEILDVVILPTSYIGAQLTVLNLKALDQKSAHHVVILPDSLTREDFRRLRVRLLWSRQVEDLADDF